MILGACAVLAIDACGPASVTPSALASPPATTGARPAGSAPAERVGPGASGGTTGSPDPFGVTTAATGSRGPLLATLAPWRLPRPLTRTVAFAAGRSIVVAGGLGPNGTVGTVERIALADGRATAVGTLPDPVHDAAGATLGSLDLVIGGGRVTQDRAVQRIAAAGGATTFGRLPTRRADLSAVTLERTLIVVGGGAGGRPDRAVLASTDGIRYRTVASLPVGVRYSAVAALDGRVWVIGGATATGDSAAIQVVDPTRGRATIAGRLPWRLSHATALVLGGRLFVLGGRRGGAPVSAILEIDPASGRATVVGRLPVAISDAAGVVVEGVGYLVGGEAAVPLDTVIEFRPG